VVTEEEIEQVAKLMKISVHDHKEFVEKVHDMINYFDILDSAGVEDEEFVVRELPLSSLRNDINIPYEEKLIDSLKNYKDHFVRAPKMI